MSRPRLLDLFCGAGGAAMGYHRAGFDVVGVDIKPQPRYPFEFHQADAMELLRGGFGLDSSARDLFSDFDAIHASPPCQKFTLFQHSQPHRHNDHPDFITPVRDHLRDSGLPWVIENVVGSILLNPVGVCGTAFGLEVPRGQLWRHRLFESSVPLVSSTCFHDRRPCVMVAGHGKDGYRGSGLSADEAREAMGIPWMTRDEIAQAIPPAYTEFIGAQLIRAVDSARRVTTPKTAVPA